MKSIYLIENNTPVVVMVEMEKPKEPLNCECSKEDYDSECVKCNEFYQAIDSFNKHLATAQRYPVGDVPKEWRVGDLVDVQLWYQRYGYATWWEYDISCIMNSEKISIVARPLISPEKPLPVGEEKKGMLEMFPSTPVKFGSCSKHPNFGYLNCPLCKYESTQPLIPSPPVKQETEVKGSEPGNRFPEISDEQYWAIRGLLSIAEAHLSFNDKMKQIAEKFTITRK